MSSSIRVRTDAAGNQVVDQPGMPTEASRPAEGREPVGQPVHKQGNIVHRYEAATGSLTRTGPTTARVAAGPSTEGFSARDGNGPVPLAMAKPGAIVQIPQLGDGKAGETDVDTAVMLGYLIPRDGGRGYAVAPGMGEPVNPKPAVQDAPEEKPAEKPVSDPDDISADGIPGTTPGADFVHGKLKDAAGPVLYNGLVQRYIAGADPTDLVESIAQRTGQSPAEVREASDGVFQEYENSAKAIAQKAGVGAHAWQDFIDWSAQNQPDAAMDAMDALVTKHEFTKLARLAKQYTRTGRGETAYSDEAILNANLGEGIQAVQTENGVILDIAGRGRFTLAKAVAYGHVRLSNAD